MAKKQKKYKLKTYKAAAKRFRVTGTGKVMRTKGGKSHLRRNRSRRTRALPGWSAFTLILAPAVFFVAFAGGLAVFVSGENPPTTAVGNAPLTVLLYALAVLSAIPWVTMGYALWSGAGETARKHKTASVGL